MVYQPTMEDLLEELEREQQLAEGGYDLNPTAAAAAAFIFRRAARNQRRRKGRPPLTDQQKQVLTRRFMKLRMEVEAEAQRLQSHGDSRPITKAYEIVAQLHRFSTLHALRVQISKYAK